MKKLIALLLLFLVSCVSGSLGIYEAGEDVYYSVVCHTDQGIYDSGCTYVNVSILNPSATLQTETTALAEKSDSLYPGLWIGKKTIPAGAEIGTWSIYISLTNSNITSGATVRNFQVVENGFPGIAENLSTIEGDTDELQKNQSYFVTAVGFLTTAQFDLNLSQLFDYGDSNWPTATAFLTTAQFDLNLSQLLTHGDSTWATAVGFSEHAASAIWSVATRALTTPIATDDSQNMTGTVADISGVSTHSAADVWTEGGRELSTPADYKADVSSLATSAELTEVNESITTRIISEIGGLGNLTLAEIWTYGTRALTTSITGSGENMSAIADISTLLTEAQFNLNVSQVLTGITTAQSNVQTSIYGLANTSATQVWAYVTRALTTPIATDNNQNMTGVSDTADVDGLLNVSQFDKNISDVRGDISSLSTQLSDTNISITNEIINSVAGLANVSLSGIWNYATRALTTPIASDNSQNMTGITASSVTAVINVSEIWAEELRLNQSAGVILNQTYEALVL